MRAQHVARSFFVVALLLSVAVCKAVADAVRLHQLSAVEVGHVQEAPGSRATGEVPLKLQTLSVNPPIFLIPGFLAENEAESLLQYVKAKKGWIASKAGAGEDEACLRKLTSGKKFALRNFDRDQDGVLKFDELKLLAQECFQLVDFEEALLDQIFEAVGEGKDAGGVPVANAQLGKGLARFFRKLLKNEPHRLERYSRTNWLAYSTPFLQSLRLRAQEVTGWPEALVNQSEELQAVHYPLKGHYSCHHDSSPDSIDGGDIRMATVGMFLNDVPAGGELAFPAADHSDAAKLTTRDFEEIEQACQLPSACINMGGVVVKPRMGDAVLWYTVNLENLQNLSRRRAGYGHKVVSWPSLHCGAQVLDGEKWFANLWLRWPTKGWQPSDKPTALNQKLGSNQGSAESPLASEL